MVESSSSVGAVNFHKQLDFISRLVNDLQISPQAIQVAIITYSDSPHLEFYLNRYTTKASMLSNIQKIGYRSGGTNTDKALQFARLNTFSHSHGGRVNVKKFIVLLTDGPASSHTRTLTEANNLKQHNVDIITVGIGPLASKAELTSVASDSNHMIYAKDFDVLQDLWYNVKAAACQGKCYK